MTSRFQPALRRLANRRLNRAVLPALCACLLALPGTAAAAFDWQIEHTGSVNDLLEVEAFHTYVTNTGTTTETVAVNMVKDLPGDWVASLCEDVLCYPPFLLDIELVIAPGATTELIIDMTPVTVQGQGSATITLTSGLNPAQTQSAVFAVVSSGHDVLFVSGIGAGAAEALVTDSITAAGRTHATWNLATMGKATGAEYTRFPTVIWAAGPYLTGMDTTDRDNLSAFVSGGGNLLLSGQNLAFASCEPTSPFYDAAAVAWFQNTLGVGYAANTGSTDYVLANAEDAVFGSTPLAINGGSGSNDNNSPDVITAFGAGFSGLQYSGGGTAEVRSVFGAGRTMFAAFGIEGIATAGERNYFMERALAFFAGDALAVGDQVQRVFASAPEAWPNPFNPRTSIRFTVGGDRAVPANVAVYDTRGRLVNRLYSGELGPGPQELVWNGQDEAGRTLATGVYLAAVRVADEYRTVKLTLIK